MMDAPPVRLRLVHVLDSLNTGGTELNAVRTAERLDRDRFDIRFLCIQPEGPLRARLDAARIPVIPIPIDGLATASAVRRGRQIRDLVRRESIDVVHAHDPYANVLAAPWVRLAGRGAVIASHRWWRDVHRRPVRVANRLAYRFAHRVLANSPSVGELVVREEGVPRKRLVVIPNFVDAVAFEPPSVSRRAELRARVGLREGELAVGVVANLYAVKDHATLLRAAARIAPAWPSLRFVIVGEGSERGALESLARQTGIADRVLMPGRIAHEPGLPAIFDVAVLTSREEGFPNFVVEAMAAGRPVVATGVGGVPDAVAEGETGYLIAPGDDSLLARSIERLLRDDALRERLGRSAVERARAAWHVDVVLGSLVALYERLVRAPGR
jgi:glycosyltransferase involved in cell wall biosynthesis